MHNAACVHKAAKIQTEEPPKRGEKARAKNEPTVVSGEPSIAYTGIDHLAIAVHNLAAAVHTYESVLGFTCTGQEALPARGIEVAFLHAGNSRVELIAPTCETSEVSKFLRERGEGVHHVCVRVQDIRGALQAMKARGARLVDDTPKPGAQGCEVAFVHPKSSPGMLLELSEAPLHATSEELFE